MITHAAPIALMLALLVGASLTANTGGADPLATLRDDGRSLRAPVATADGVLDILVIHSAKNANIRPSSANTHAPKPRDLRSSVESATVHLQ